MIIDGAMGTVIQQYKLQVQSRLPGCALLRRPSEPSTHDGTWECTGLREEDFRATETFNDDAKWTAGERALICRNLSVPPAPSRAECSAAGAS